MAFIIPDLLICDSPGTVFVVLNVGDISRLIRKVNDARLRDCGNIDDLTVVQRTPRDIVLRLWRNNVLAARLGSEDSYRYNVGWVKWISCTKANELIYCRQIDISSVSKRISRTTPTSSLKSASTTTNAEGSILIAVLFQQIPVEAR
jgi:hypothetical protein